MALAADLAPGTTLASYTIESVLGRGGMSVVYAAFDERLRRQVALKLLGPADGDDGLRERFLRESRLAASLDHPNVIPVYEAGEAAGALFIAMRLVRGTDLRGLLAREGPLEPERALAIVAQTAGALDAAHANGLMHRDVKPGNILLLQRGESDEEHVYLSDFGLAIPGVAGALEHSRFHGTAAYAAPEQIRGQPEARSDVYSLGCVLFECLAGEPPFGRKRLLATLWSHQNEPPPRVTELRRELPAALDDVIARALAKDPGERYASGLELVAAARKALGLERARQPQRRSVVLAAAGVVTVAAAAAAFLLARDEGAPPADLHGAGVISTVPGSGGIVANDGRGAPWAIAAGRDGRVYVVGSDEVLRLDGRGATTTVAGTGEFGYSGDGGPATKARLAGDMDIALDAEGRLYILQTYRPALRRIDEDGVIRTIAGTGAGGFLDDGPRTARRDLCAHPVGPALDPAGGIYVACTIAHRVIRIEGDGSYRTVAGSASAGDSGDGGPATAAQLNRPSGIAVDSRGNLYIADTLNNRVRKVDASGTITTVAGTGRPGHSGDGWQATAVDLWNPVSVAVDAAGNLYIVEAATHRVRKVDRRGIISTVAGTGRSGFSGDGGRADQAALDTPDDVAVDRAGNVYVSDRGNRRVRVIRFGSG